MPSQIIPNTRIHPLKDRPRRSGDYVLYWMQQSQRPTFNHALEHAVRTANDAGLPLLVVFGLMDAYPEANERHYHFMLQGLRDTQQQLARRGIPLTIQHGNPDDVALRFGENAATIVCDRGYTRIQRKWRRHVAEAAACEVVEVESDLVVPIEVASDKAEFAARTIRPKLHRHIDDYLIALRPTPIEHDSTSVTFDRKHEVDVSDVSAALQSLDLDRSVPASPLFEGGPTAAKRLLKRFLKDGLPLYTTQRNHPRYNSVSHMSMYLHFGHISPVEIALAVRDAEASQDDIDAYLEELIVRRELAHNFVWYNERYDKFTCLPDWAQRTLDEHADDPRDPHYTPKQLEDADTHDPYWNAAMREMRETGYMHNYMRMYWGKKILEWSSSPRQAYRTTLRLNNRYFIDGRDANSYANVAWIFGLHDRPWQKRPVFGTVRYMAATGLERKTDPNAYVEKVDALIEQVQKQRNA